MKLRKQDQEFRNTKVFYPDPKNIDLDRVLINLFLLMKCGGTRPVTNLNTAAGDDVVYVSDAADLRNFAAAAAAANRDLAALDGEILHGEILLDDLSFHGSLDQASVQIGTGPAQPPPAPQPAPAPAPSPAP